MPPQFVEKVADEDDLVELLLECQHSPLAFGCAQRPRKEVLAGEQHHDYIIKGGFAGGKLDSQELSH